MNIPRDIPLATWIRELIATNRLIVFYKSKEWIELKNEVMQENHFECQECLKRGKVTTSDLHVHHVNEVRTHPELALSKYYIDKNGEQQKNLIPLCRKHHNEVHDRFSDFRQRNGKERFENEERW